LREQIIKSKQMRKQITKIKKLYAHIDNYLEKVSGAEQIIE
jgi:hypothetical protein